MRTLFTTIFVGLCLICPSLADDFRSLQGKFLIAERKMDDPNFSKTVILIIEHDRAGAMGLIVNREMGKGPLKDILKPLGIPSEDVEEKGQAPVRLHFGGPVEFGRAFVLHSGDYREGGTIPVLEGVSLTSQPGVLKSIANGKGPSRYVLLLGYAGWAPGQLEAEMKRGGWETAPADAEITLDGDVKTKWERAIAKVSVPL
jgi:putative transcriptional regulator